MVDRIEVIASSIDPRGEAMRRRLAAHGFSGIRDIRVVDNYMLAQTLKAEQLAAVARMLTNPVIERSSVNQALHPELFDWAIEVGYLPGVKDNVASTTQEGIEALLDQRFDDQIVASSQTLFLAGDITETEARAVADGQYNPLIQHAVVKSRSQFLHEGGMGAYGPTPHVATEMDAQWVRNYVMAPVINELARRGTQYTGFLYAGMMRTKEGLHVLEFNARHGDPECQPNMVLLNGDLYAALQKSLENGRLDTSHLLMRPGAACCVVLADKGYPDSGKLTKGQAIHGIEEAERIEGVKVFHAGTAFADGAYRTNGGRVLGVTAYHPLGISAARRNAYHAARIIDDASDPHLPLPHGYRREGAEVKAAHTTLPAKARSDAARPLHVGERDECARDRQARREPQLGRAVRTGACHHRQREGASERRGYRRGVS